MNSTRFPADVDKALRSAGWQPGRWDIRQAEVWADTLRAHVSPGGHRHSVFPAAVEAWAEFGGLTVPAVAAPGRHVAPNEVHLDPLRGLHLARTLGDLGTALGTEVAPLGEESAGYGHLAIDAEGRVYCVDHTGDYYVGPSIDAAIGALATGTRPHRLTT
ncbi:SUKH-3 domain-containing protein [Streptomyces sp. ME03-5709C]|nr:SUKH-3 domain-containing protein [Streptomyces sp. ME03-5709C]